MACTEPPPIFRPRRQQTSVPAAPRQRPMSAKLSGVKFELYHPHLPTLRRMDMDTVCHKLPSEHSRTTTICSREDFVKAKSSLWAQKPSRVHCKTILDRPTVVAMETYQPHGTGYTDNWNAILSGIKSQVNKQREDSINFEIDGLALRRRHPSITSAWQHTRPLTSQGSRPTTPKPMPATMYSRYRGARPFSANPWK